MQKKPIWRKKGRAVVDTPAIGRYLALAIARNRTPYRLPLNRGHLAPVMALPQPVVEIVSPQRPAARLVAPALVACENIRGRQHRARARLHAFAPEHRHNIHPGLIFGRCIHASRRHIEAIRPVKANTLDAPIKQARKARLAGAASREDPCSARIP